MHFVEEDFSQRVDIIHMVDIIVRIDFSEGTVGTSG